MAPQASGLPRREKTRCRTSGPRGRRRRRNFRIGGRYLVSRLPTGQWPPVLIRAEPEIHRPVVGDDHRPNPIAVARSAVSKERIGRARSRRRIVGAFPPVRVGIHQKGGTDHRSSCSAACDSGDDPVDLRPGVDAVVVEQVTVPHLIRHRKFRRRVHMLFGHDFLLGCFRADDRGQGRVDETCRDAVREIPRQLQAYVNCQKGRLDHRWADESCRVRPPYRPWHPEALCLITFGTGSMAAKPTSTTARCCAGDITPSSTATASRPGSPSPASSGIGSPAATTGRRLWASPLATTRSHRYRRNRSLADRPATHAPRATRAPGARRLRFR
jgi:hypothetical protein